VGAVGHGLSLARRRHVYALVRVRRRGGVVLGRGVGGVVVFGRGSQSFVGMVQLSRLEPAGNGEAAGVVCIFMRLIRIHIP
jgi:hypothetical protein